MKLENEFTVPASIDQAWAVLLDVPRVAPCLPGATVEPGGGEDGVFKGAMKIKIGPITASYKGTVKIEEADEAAHRVAMKAQAKDARGQGTAAATITSTMEEVADGTKVHVVTDMRITGPAASVRPRRDAGRLREADGPLRRLPRRGDAQRRRRRRPRARAPAEAAEPTTAAAEPEAAAPAPAEASTKVEDTGVPGASSGVSSADTETKIPSASSGTSSTSDRAAHGRRARPRRGEPRRRAQARPPARRRRRRAADPDPPDQALTLDPELQRILDAFGRSDGPRHRRCRSSRRAPRTSPRPSSSRGRGPRSRTSTTTRPRASPSASTSPRARAAPSPTCTAAAGCSGNLDSVDAVCRALANEARRARRQHRLPARARAPVPGGARRRARGDAAARTPTSSPATQRGANLAAVVARGLRDQIKLQLLVYPVTDAGVNTPSYARVRRALRPDRRRHAALLAACTSTAPTACTPTPRRCAPTDLDGRRARLHPDRQP